MIRSIKVVFGVVGQGEGGAGSCRVHGALAVKLFHSGVGGLALVAEQAFAVGTVLPGVLAGVVPSDGFGEGTVVDGAHRALRTGREAAVVTLAEPPPVLVDYSVSGRACVAWGFSFYMVKRSFSRP